MRGSLPTTATLPPPTRWKGLLAVAIHILQVRATVHFDAAAHTASVDATLDFRVGPSSGHPFFDLRQHVGRCWLDGAEIDPGQIAAVDVGAGPACTVRILRVRQQAGSVHQLRFRYRLGLPQAELGGSYPPQLRWRPNGGLDWTLGMSDLFAGRYLEAWFPANLPFDQFPVTLNCRIIGTPVLHAVLSNGAVQPDGANAWSVEFPRNFSALSPLLEIHPWESVRTATVATTLPSGAAVDIEAWKLAAGQADLGLGIERIQALLQANERNYGAFLADRFVCVFTGTAGGMEYHCAATTSWRALGHEVFHSWFSRGVTPAGQSDGWWDEGFTYFHDHGANAVEPFDFREAPVQLCPRQPFARRTAPNAYADGSRFFRGLSAALGPDRLRAAMRAIYEQNAGRPLSTADLEAGIITATSRADLVDAFHRFVYGFPDPTPSARLSLGTSPSGAVWVRHNNDGGLAHESPVAGEDNWLCARVCNDVAAGPCDHFAVVFTLVDAGAPAGFPTRGAAAEYAECAAVVCSFDLPPGGEQVVAALWPRALVPSSGTAVRVVAAVHYRGRHPSLAARVEGQPLLGQCYAVGA